MRSLGFYLYLPKLSSIKSLRLLRQKVKRRSGVGKEPDLFLFLSGRVKSCFFKVAFHKIFEVFAQKSQASYGNVRVSLGT